MIFFLEVIPHITEAIQEWVERVARISVDSNEPGEPEICVIEVIFKRGILLDRYES